MSSHQARTTDTRISFQHHFQQVFFHYFLLLRRQHKTMKWLSELNKKYSQLAPSGCPLHCHVTSFVHVPPSYTFPFFEPFNSHHVQQNLEQKAMLGQQQEDCCQISSFSPGPARDSRHRMDIRAGKVHTATSDDSTSRRHWRARIRFYQTAHQN